MSRACSLSLSLASLLASLAAVHGENAKTPRTDLYGDPLPPGAVARLGTMRLRHAQADVAFSKDDKQLLSFGRNGEFRVWDVATGKLVRQKRLTKDHGREAALSPDGTRAAAWRATEVILYDTATGEERGRLSAGSPLNYGYYPRKQLAFSPDGKVLAAGDQMWDLAANKIREVGKHERLTVLWMIAVAPGGKRLAEITKHESELDELRGQVHLWDTATGREIGEELRGASLAFSSDGKTLAVGGFSEVRLLDAATLEKKAALPEGHGVYRLAFSPDGRFLAGSYRGSDVLLWDVAAAKGPKYLPGSGPDVRFAFTSDSKVLASQSNATGRDIRLWDTASGRRLLSWPGHDRLVEALAVSPDGRRIASADKDALYLWDSAGGKLLRQWNEGDSFSHACLFSADGNRLICARQDYALVVRDVVTGKELRRMEIDHPDSGGVRFHALALSTDGKRLTAVAVGEKSAKLYVWDLDSGKLLRQAPYQLEERIVGLSRGRREPWRFAHAALSPAADVVSVWRDGRVALAEVATGTLLARLPRGMGVSDHPWWERRSRAMVFSPDGRLVTAARLQPRKGDVGWNDCKGLALIETATGEEVFRLDIGDFDRVAFTPDGHGVLVVDKKELRVWDALTGARLHRMAWPRSVVNARGEATVSSLAVLPGGRVATGMAEGDILIWDLAPSKWPAPKPPSDLGRKELDALWSDLAGEARKAHRAIGTLVGASAQTVSFLKDHLRPAAVDTKRIEKLLADLDSDSFEGREAASRELARMRYRVEPMLRKALEGKPSLEARRRIESVLSGPKKPRTEDLRRLRALAVLERIGTPEARRILEKLDGAPAQAALQRLNRRDAWARGRSSP